MNQGADALSRQHLLLLQLDACILGFQHLKALYKDDEDLGEIYKECLRHCNGDFLLRDGYLFKSTRLCTPKCGISEVHGASLASHYGVNKTCAKGALILA